MITQEISADVRAMADYLAAVPVGERITYADLSAVISRDIRLARHVFYAGARVAMRESNAIFTGVPRTGYRRLSSIEASEIVGSHARSKIRGVARRGNRAISAAFRSSNTDSPEVQRRLSAEASVLGLVEMIARDANVKVSPNAPTRPAPVAEAAKQFLARIGASPE